MTIEAPATICESPRRRGRQRGDLTGQTFNRLTVLSMVPVESGPSYALVRCECGVEKSVRASSLKAGLTQSCGCLMRERVGAAHRGKFVTSTPTYNTAHSRVRRARGSASGHICPCGAQAAEWAYSHADMNEYKETQTDGRSGRVPKLVAYSGDPSFYDALCRSCHVKRDHAHKKESK